MGYPLKDYAKYYLPFYLTWAVLGPTFLLLANYPYEETILDIILFQASSKFVYAFFSFYLIFGLIWPLTIVVYIAFFISITNKYGIETLADAFSQFDATLSVFFWTIAFLGPILSICVATMLHINSRIPVSKLVKDRTVSSVFKGINDAFFEFLQGFV